MDGNRTSQAEVDCDETSTVEMLANVPTYLSRVAKTEIESGFFEGLTIG
jgi:hypothetical protein